MQSRVGTSFVHAGLLAFFASFAATGPVFAQSPEETIAKLEERVKSLEDKLAEIQQDGMKVKAPFSVVNAQGDSIFEVLPSGSGGAFVLVGGKGKILLETDSSVTAGGAITINGSGGGEVAFQAGEIGGKATALVGDKAAGHVLLQSDGTAVEVTAQQGDDRAVKMEVSGENVVVKATNAGNTTTVGDAGGTLGVTLESGGTKMGELSKWPDRQFASVRIYGSAGAVAAGLGVDINNPGSGLLTVFSAGDSNGVLLNGDGTVTVKRDGGEKIKLDAAKQTITMTGAAGEAIKLDAGKQTLAVKGSGSASMLIDGAKGFSAMNGEKKLATLGANPAGSAGQLWVFSGNGMPVFSASAEGSGADVVIGDEATPHISINTNNGKAEIAAEGGESNSIAMIAASGLAQLRADMAGASATFGRVEGAIGMTIESGNDTLAQLVKPTDRVSASLKILGPSGDLVAGIGGQSGDAETGIVVVNGGGNNQAMMTGEGWFGLKENNKLKVVASAPDNVIALYGGGSEYIVTLSPSSSGGGNITTYDTGGTGVFSAGAATDGGGEACVIRQNGGYCLGIGLPLMGGGN